MKIELTLTVLHGTTDKAAATKVHLEHQIRANVPEKDRTPEPACDVFAIFVNGDVRLELPIRSWEDAAGLQEGKTYTMSLE